MDTSPSKLVTISDMISQYLDMVKLARSMQTMLTYRNALRIFQKVLIAKKLDPDNTSIAKLSEDFISPLAQYLKTYSPATEQVYLQAVKGFYEYVDSEQMAVLNQSRIRVLIRQRSRRPGFRIPQSHMDDIAHLLAQAEDVENIINLTSDEDQSSARLRAYRDRAFLLTLADTGFRVHEACKLRRGDVDWNEQHAIIIGKGNKQAVVRFTQRSLEAIKDYLSLRATLDGISGRPLTSLPIFARHDKGAGKKVKPMTPTTGRRIVRERVVQLLGQEMIGKITPHTFRHYFVTSVLRATGNLRYAQELARHKNIAVTERYTQLTNDELDKAYYDVFEKKTKPTKS
jgi:integrase/recombinase XerC